MGARPGDPCPTRLHDPGGGREDDDTGAGAAIPEHLGEGPTLVGAATGMKAMIQGNPRRPPGVLRWAR